MYKKLGYSVYQVVHQYYSSDDNKHEDALGNEILISNFRYEKKPQKGSQGKFV